MFDRIKLSPSTIEIKISDDGRRVITPVINDPVTAHTAFKACLKYFESIQSETKPGSVNPYIYDVYSIEETFIAKHFGDDFVACENHKNKKLITKIIELEKVINQNKKYTNTVYWLVIVCCLAISILLLKLTFIK